MDLASFLSSDDAMQARMIKITNRYGAIVPEACFLCFCGLNITKRHFVSHSSGKRRKELFSFLPNIYERFAAIFDRVC